MKEMTGQLYFSDQEPHIVGQLVILGVMYEISGVRISKVRTEITARKRGDMPVQQDIFEGHDR